MHRSRERLAGMRARVARLPDAQLEERAVVVDDGGRLERVLLVLLQGNPIGRIVGEELQPLLVALGVEEPGLVIQELLRTHCAVMESSHARIWPRMKTSLVPVAPRVAPASATSRPAPRPMYAHSIAPEAKPRWMRS